MTKFTVKAIINDELLVFDEYGLGGAVVLGGADNLFTVISDAVIHLIDIHMDIHLATWHEPSSCDDIDNCERSK